MRLSSKVAVGMSGSGCIFSIGFLMVSWMVFWMMCAGCSSPASDPPVKASVEKTATKPAALAEKTPPTPDKPTLPKATKEETLNARSGTFRADLLSFETTNLQTSGGLDPATFRRVMNKRKSSFKVCYQKALAKDPMAAGQIRVGFTISPTGRVSTVKIIKNTLGSKDTEACIVRVIRRVQFPTLASGKRVAVEYPLVFSP